MDDKFRLEQDRIGWSNFEVANYFPLGASSSTWHFQANSLALKTSPPNLSSQPWGRLVSTWLLCWTTSESRCEYLCVFGVFVSGMRGAAFYSAGRGKGKNPRGGAGRR